MIVRVRKVRSRWPIAVVIIGVGWLPTGCGTSVPSPPTEAWSSPSANSKAGEAPKVSRKKTSREEDAELSGREKRALLKQSKTN